MQGQSRVGGWGALLRTQGQGARAVGERAYHYNRMELMGAISALER